jgi:hypothetical protein
MLEYLNSFDNLESHQQVDYDYIIPREKMLELRWRLDSRLEGIEDFNFSKIEEILT